MKRSLLLPFAPVVCFVLTLAAHAYATPPDADGPGCVAAQCEAGEQADDTARNVLGEPLAVCSMDPLTGYFRDGLCRTDASDRGVHVVCAEVTDEFLAYSASRGNELRVASARSQFPGLDSGDRWCLCAARWEEARRAGVAPPVVLEATDSAAHRIVDAAALQEHARSSSGTE